MKKIIIYGFDYDSSTTIKICVIGEKENELKNWSKRFFDRKIANYKINWEAYIFPNLTDETEDSIMNSILSDIFGIPEGEGEEEEEENNSENKTLKTSKNNIIIKFSLNNVGIILDCMDYIQKIYLSQLAIITNDDVREIKDNRFLAKKKYWFRII